MEAQDYLDRAKLRELMHQHPEWGKKKLAKAIGRSAWWVKKWRGRLKAADPQDEEVLCSRSSAPKSPPASVHPAIVQRILEIRGDPPGNLKRIPGPLAIRYYLEQDETLRAQHLKPPSTSTIWKVLDAHGCIYRPQPHEHQPWERPEPLRAWQIDFKDASTVPAEPDGKRQHVVEVLNVVDIGTSLLLEALPREDYSAETAILALTNTLLVNGLPDQITCDRDPRFVGSNTGSDFPSTFVRYLTCLGISVNLCPPRRPDRNAFVERFNRSYNEECLQVHRPTTLEAVQTVTDHYRDHYNRERPNQAKTCGNQPPTVAFPTLPLRPALPDQVDPDQWLERYHLSYYKRRVSASGKISIDRHNYYINRQLAGREVVLKLDGRARTFEVLLEGKPIKSLPVKGLYQATLAFEDYLRFICEEARTEWRQTRRKKATWRRH